MSLILISVIIAVVIIVTSSIVISKKSKDPRTQIAENEKKSDSPITGRPLDAKQTTSSIQSSTTRVQPVSTPQTIHVYNDKQTPSPFVENLPNINYSKEIFVEYDAKRWENISFFYPYVKVPNKSTRINYPVEGKNSRKGMIEKSFCKDFLSIYFKGLIYDNLTVFIRTTPYEPDIALIDFSKNLFIDIEVDEPYDGVNRNPIHYVEYEKSIDESRNKGFADRGWLVIRFSEKQVKEQPIQCCKFIYDIVKFITNISIPNLEKVSSIVKENMWTKDEAIEMTKNKVREKYLGISQFQQGEIPRNDHIKDYEAGEKIENEILSQSKSPNSQPIPKPFSVTAATSSVAYANSPTPTTHLQEPRISTQPTNQPSAPAPRPYAL